MNEKDLNLKLKQNNKPDDEKSDIKVIPKKIPEAEFIVNVDHYLNQPPYKGNADLALKLLDEEYGKYKFMEINLNAKRKKLLSQIPDLEKSLNLIEKLQKQKEEFETEFWLAEKVFAKALIPPTDHVYLYLGAHVMLEYKLEEAKELLSCNLQKAKHSLKNMESDLDFLRDQYTTVEVNMARVYNWQVKTS